MAIFPTDIDIQAFSEESTRAINKSSYEGGYEQKRPKYTRSFKKFTLGFSVLTAGEATTLESFIMDNQGSSFSFVHPFTSVTYEVTHEGDSLSISYLNYKQRSTSLTLREV